jgi:hypothetical protein
MSYNQPYFVVIGAEIIRPTTAHGFVERPAASFWDLMGWIR